MLTSFARRCLVLCAVALPVTAVATVDRQAEVFGKALEAARNSQWATLDSLQPELGEHFVLQGYLDFHRIREQLGKAPVEQVLAYTRKYDDSACADWRWTSMPNRNAGATFRR